MFILTVSELCPLQISAGGNLTMMRLKDFFVWMPFKQFNTISLILSITSQYYWGWQMVGGCQNCLQNKMKARISMFCDFQAKATLHSQMSIRLSVSHRNLSTAWNHHPSTLIILRSFFHFATFKLFSLFRVRFWKTIFYLSKMLVF